MTSSIENVSEPTIRQDSLSARLEPFDSFWQGPEDVEKGYRSFGQFYRANYLKYLPQNRQAKVLVVSCGPGYFVQVLNQAGYQYVLGIDSDPAKIKYAHERNLNCRVEQAFALLERPGEVFDLIICEQELNHLTKAESVEFLHLCYQKLGRGGTLLVNGLNGANPITGAEALAQNIDHFSTFTEYSLTQLLQYAGFTNIRVFPLNLYVFYTNPLNYVGLIVTGFLHLFFRLLFKIYGKSNTIFSKKIAAICVKPT